VAVYLKPLPTISGL